KKRCKQLQYSITRQKTNNQPVIPRSLIVKVQGVSLPDHIAKAFEAASAFTPDPSDLIIISYPKSGTTWIQEIVDLLLHNGDDGSSKRASIVKRHPFLEYCICYEPSGLDLLKEMDPPRVIKTHMPLQLVPAGFWENKCKIIYIARNAKDTLVSYYHFLRMSKISPEPGPWEGFIHKFMRGELGWGSWYDHVKGYWEEREKRNILFLFYEDMKENPRREIERIMKYLDLYLPDDVISHIVEMTTFKNMEENPMVNYSFFGKEIFDQTISKFMRKGEIGDWKNHFTPEQSAEFDEDYQKKMKNVNIPFRAQF
uniref:Sulfotransferase n=1 Tax=Hippocampus comes TaxID=109280 RepID=A0A3Q3E540_HIPCM